MKPTHCFLLALSTSSVLFAGLPACAGRTLDVGTANESAISVEAGPDVVAAEQPAVDVSAIAGLWVMVRQDAELGVADPAGPPPMELEISSPGVVYRSSCARPAGEVPTTACPPASTLGCISGTAKPEGNRWRLDLPAIRIATPEQGEALLMTNGELFVRYINPSYSAGYFHRVGSKDEAGGCPR